MAGLIDFVSTNLLSELSAVKYLQSHGIIPTDLPCQCGANMALRSRKQRSGNTTVVWRCSKKDCRSEKSVRSNCCFLAYKRSDGRLRASLTLRKIVEVVYTWLYFEPTQRKMQKTSKCGSATVTDWLYLCREVCSHAIEKAPKLVGTLSKPVQIDEAYFSGRRKYKKGRLLSGDYGIAHGNTRKNNYGDQVIGPWVLGIYQSASNVRFIVVPDRKSTTLLPIISKYVEKGSVVVTDEWAPYNQLNEEGYHHETVNHSENYVNPVTGFNTQGVERSWVDAKAMLKKSRHPSNYLQSHLDEVAWRKMKEGEGGCLIEAFLKDVAKHYKFS